MHYAIQLYSVRDEIQDGESFLRALEEVKAMGYDGVEMAGYYGLTAPELKDALNRLGLAAVCCHEVIDRLENQLDDVLAYASALGLDKVAMAWSPCNSEAEVARTLRVLVRAEEAARPLGITICYHNHDHEFRPVGGALPIDRIRRVVPLELDTFWSFVAGYASADYIRRNRADIGLLHLKDGVVATRTPCALGEGENDVRAIALTARELGYDWLIVENDTPKPSGFEAARRSADWLRKNIG